MPEKSDAKVVDDRPEWVKNPPLDQVVVAQVPECDGDGSVVQMQFFNAAGERVR